jgi:ribonucleoside-diphosphate reductase alpha chain
VAPTGTIATVSGCEAYGCEPAFALAYIRHFKDGDEDVELTYSSPLFMQALERAGLDEETCSRIVQQVSITGSCQGIAEVPAEIRHVFVVANDIAAEEHVRMQAALQAFLDNSISKTINFPEGA